ncbi:amidohydrolase [Halodurantibacterium flavum]|uniref:Amidohydrolase n=1 Tax=Halodurantibacterium flavum TaxID=1382802 RepID=A0ABW4RZC6_9RHOB
MSKPPVFPAQKQSAVDWIDDNTSALSADHKTIFDFHEPAWREYKSAAWYVKRLREEGFTVEEASGGMPTAFCAEWSNGDGPVIGGYAEYDAVPGFSQDTVPHRQPRPGTNRYAAGHTDPHSALGIGAFAGFLAAKHAMEKHGIPGKLKFFGEPAEKMCGSKPIHATRGYYDDLDAAISFHPHSFPHMGNGCFWDTASAPLWSRIYTFRCDEPETWQQNATERTVAHKHASARAPGAIDAVCLMYTSGKYMKESMLPHQGSWSLNEFIVQAGQATADNVAPGLAQIQYTLRAPNVEMCEKVFEVLDRNAEHVAAMAHCTVEIAWVTRARPGLPNHAMAEVTWRNFEKIGAPVWSEEACDYAWQILENIGVRRGDVDHPFAPEIRRLATLEEGEAGFRNMLPPWQKNFAADDYVEYTWHAPTVRLYVGRPTLQMPSGKRCPEWARLAMGGMAACIDPMWITASKVVSTTIIDLLTDGESLAKARAEFEDRTGGGIGGSKWLPPLLPSDFAPPVDYRWPEYVTTARGEEWTIPTAFR